MAEVTTTDKASEFCSRLQEVERDSHALRQAMMARRPDGIWDAIADQEKSLRKLQAFYKDMGFVDAADVSDPNVADILSGKSVREMIAKTQGLLATNKRLASTFLDVIDRSLSQITTGEHTAGTYRPNGKLSGVTPPCFVHQQV
ncbi:MAG: hypothetical protein EOM20_01650 [Spartobacteria bacterium]|nr:hypothetical protein [Spartobacteria bacterium]